MATLKDQIRGAAKIAEETCETGDFNAMSWMDEKLEDNPDFFDGLFDTPWHELSDDEKINRARTIRSVL